MLYSRFRLSPEDLWKDGFHEAAICNGNYFNLAKGFLAYISEDKLMPNPLKFSSSHQYWDVFSSWLRFERGIRFERKYQAPRNDLIFAENVPVTINRDRREVLMVISPAQVNIGDELFLYLADTSELNSKEIACRVSFTSVNRIRANYFDDIEDLKHIENRTCNIRLFSYERNELASKNWIKTSITALARFCTLDSSAEFLDGYLQSIILALPNVSLKKQGTVSFEPYLPLSVDQHKAYLWSSKVAFTLVSGVHGTGKTQLALTIAHNFARRGRVLMIAPDTFSVSRLVHQLRKAPDVVVTFADRIKDRDANIICSTPENCQYFYEKNMDFHAVVVDDADRIMEINTLIPIMAGAVKKVALIGNPDSYPFGVMLRRKSLENAFRLSMFHRLLNVGPIRCFTLTSQYRLHPFLGSFLGYKGMDYDNREDSRYSAMGNLFDNREKPIKWISIQSTMRSSLAVERVIVSIFEELYQKSIPHDKVGIITFFDSQADYLCEALTEHTRPRHSIYSKGFAEWIEKILKRNCGNVDFFTSAQFDLVVVMNYPSINLKTNSALRMFHYISETEERTRINLAFSRARHGLIVILDESDLEECSFNWKLWEQYVNFSRDHNCWVKRVDGAGSRVVQLTESDE